MNKIPLLIFYINSRMLWWSNNVFNIHRQITSGVKNMYEKSKTLEGCELLTTLAKKYGLAKSAICSI